MLCIDNPFTHHFDRGENLFFLLMQAHNSFEASETIFTCFAYHSSFFQAFLSSPEYEVMLLVLPILHTSKGALLSICKAPSTVAAYSSKI